MSFNQYVDDLRSDALFRAGEPQDSTSSLWTKSLDYLNRIQQVLLLGGGVAVGRDLATSAGIYAHVVNPPITDWWWARKQPRGVIVTLAAINAGTVALTQGSTAVVFSSAPAVSVAGWRVQANYLPTVPMIQVHTAGSTSATLDAVWPEATVTAGQYFVFQLEYALPSDFLRFAGTPYLHSNYQDVVQVGVREGLDINYPLSSVRREIPVAAALIQPQRLQFSSYDTRGYRVEFDYIVQPPDLQAGGAALLPPHHRQVLSVGAAMLMCFDKGDGRAQNLASEYRELVNVMLQEHRRMMAGGSNTFGQFKTRSGGSGRYRGVQSNGSEFLI